MYLWTRWNIAHMNNTEKRLIKDISVLIHQMLSIVIQGRLRVLRALAHHLQMRMPDWHNDHQHA